MHTSVNVKGKQYSSPLVDSTIASSPTLGICLRTLNDPPGPHFHVHKTMSPEKTAALNLPSAVAQIFASNCYEIFIKHLKGENTPHMSVRILPIGLRIGQ